jgi:hypothetical protein
MVDVSRWLAEQGLGHHAEAFAENGIGGDILRELTEADLKELGLDLGDRKRLLKAVAALDVGSVQDRMGKAEPTAALTCPSRSRAAAVDGAPRPSCRASAQCLQRQSRCAGQAFHRFRISNR